LSLPGLSLEAAAGPAAAVTSAMAPAVMNVVSVESVFRFMHRFMAVTLGRPGGPGVDDCVKAVGTLKD
jgi:hypothetical protein